MCSISDLSYNQRIYELLPFDYCEKSVNPSMLAEQYKEDEVKQKDKNTC